MSKREASSSPVVDQQEAKKIKLNPAATPEIGLVDRQAQETPSDELEVGDDLAQQGETKSVSPRGKPDADSELPEDKSPSAPASIDPIKVKDEKKKPSRKAGEGFDAWVPKEAAEPIPEVQPHWAVIPRTGATRPSELQPSARKSCGAIVPPLWEDRKGAVRLKRGSRFIKGYDQAKHMYLPLMNVRPISKKNQTPKREAVAYFYRHGMPSDWNNTGVLNDVNKALQAAINANSNDEAPFTSVERNALTKIFTDNQDISLWDAAEQFNDLVHPINGSEEGQYPSGRFIESIQHEFSMYKSSYLKGEAPTDKTKKDIELENLYKEWKTEQAQEKADAKKMAKKSASDTMSGANGVAKPKRAKQSKFSPEMLAAMEARADATSKEIEDADAAEAAAKAAAEDPTLATAEAPTTIDPPRLSYEQEGESEVAGAYAPENARPSSPTSASAHAKVNDEIVPKEVVSQTEIVAQTTVAAPRTEHVEKAVRDVEIDENYDEEL